MKPENICLPTRINLLRKYYEKYDPISIENESGKTIYIYQETDVAKLATCEIFSITGKKHEGFLFCSSCRIGKYNKSRKRRMRIKEDISRRRPVRCMSPKELLSEFDKLKSDNKNMSRKIERLQKKIESSKKELIFEDGSVAKQQLQNALSYVELNWNDCKIYIIEELLSIADCSGGTDKLNSEDKENAICLLLQQMENMSMDFKKGQGIKNIHMR